MNNFRQSTQKKNWIYNESGLNQINATKFTRGLKILEELKKQNEQVSLKSFKPDDEKVIIAYFAHQIVNIIDKKNLPNSLKV